MEPKVVMLVRQSNSNILLELSDIDFDELGVKVIVQEDDVFDEYIKQSGLDYES